MNSLLQPHSFLRATIVSLIKLIFCMKNKKAADLGAIALSYPHRVRVRATVKLSAAFFHDDSSITIGGVRKCNSAQI